MCYMERNFSLETKTIKKTYINAANAGTIVLTKKKNNSQYFRAGILRMAMQPRYRAVLPLRTNMKKQSMRLGFRQVDES